MSNEQHSGAESPSLDAAYWSGRWARNETGWDYGHASPAIRAFAEAHIPQGARILIPGAGNGWEAEWLYRHEWFHVTVLDIARAPLDQLQARFPDFPSAQLVHSDFFAHTGQYDFILEQTFFCALAPSLRPAYAAHMARLLRPGGMLAGLLFNFPLTDAGPPFGGSREEYEGHLEPWFEVQEMATTYLSIKPRAGREYWFEAKRKM